MARAVLKQRVTDAGAVLALAALAACQPVLRLVRMALAVVAARAARTRRVVLDELARLARPAHGLVKVCRGGGSVLRLVGYALAAGALLARAAEAVVVLRTAGDAGLARLADARLVQGRVGHAGAAGTLAARRASTAVVSWLALPGLALAAAGPVAARSVVCLLDLVSLAVARVALVHHGAGLRRREDALAARTALRLCRRVRDAHAGLAPLAGPAGRRAGAVRIALVAVVRCVVVAVLAVIALVRRGVASLLARLRLALAGLAEVAAVAVFGVLAVIALVRRGVASVHACLSLALAGLACGAVRPAGRTVDDRRLDTGHARVACVEGPADRLALA